MKIIMWSAAAMAAALAIGCGSPEAESVEPSFAVLGSSASALSAANSLKAVNGTYTNCAQRTGTWSARISGTDPLANSALSVVMNDTSCLLKVTSLVADQTYAAASPITLGTSYPGSATHFQVSGSTVFDANAKVDSISFASDFQITIAYSEDSSSTDTGDFLGTYATVQASTVSTIVSPPNYTSSFSGGTAFGVQLDVNKVVQSVTGNMTLTDGTRTGTTYVIDQGTLGTSPDYVAVTLAYTTGTQRTISGANPTIPASQFGLVGANLSSPVVRTVIISRTLGGVLAHQLFKVTFKSP